MTQASSEVEKTLGLGSKGRRRPAWGKYATVAVLLIGAALAWTMLDGTDNGIRYVTAEATTADLRVTVTATGTIEPTNLVEISSELSGTACNARKPFSPSFCPRGGPWYRKRREVAPLAAVRPYSLTAYKTIESNALKAYQPLSAGRPAFAVCALLATFPK